MLYFNLTKGRYTYEIVSNFESVLFDFALWERLIKHN